MNLALQKNTKKSMKNKTNIKHCTMHHFFYYQIEEYRHLNLDVTFVAKISKICHIIEKQVSLSMVLQAYNLQQFSHLPNLTDACFYFQIHP